MDEINRKIINALQMGFPVSDRPFLEVAQQLEIPEELLINRVKAMREDGTLTRFGPMYDAKLMGGNFSLCAMSVPDEKFEEVAEKVNSLTEVAHNYRRDHSMNMWFVLATERDEDIDQSIEIIEQMTDLPVYNLPKLKEFYVGLYLQV